MDNIISGDGMSDCFMNDRIFPSPVGTRTKWYLERLSWTNLPWVCVEKIPNPGIGLWTTSLLIGLSMMVGWLWVWVSLSSPRFMLSKKEEGIFHHFFINSTLTDDSTTELPFLDIFLVIYLNKDRRSSKFASSFLTKSSFLPSQSSFLPHPPSFQIFLPS